MNHRDRERELKRLQREFGPFNEGEYIVTRGEDLKYEVERDYYMKLYGINKSDEDYE